MIRSLFILFCFTLSFQGFPKNKKVLFLADKGKILRYAYTKVLRLFSPTLLKKVSLAF